MATTEDERHDDLFDQINEMIWSVLLRVIAANWVWVGIIISAYFFVLFLLIFIAWKISFISK